MHDLLRPFRRHQEHEEGGGCSELLSTVVGSTRSYQWPNAMTPWIPPPRTEIRCDFADDSDLNSW